MDYKQYLQQKSEDAASKPKIMKYGEKVESLIQQYPKLKPYKYELWYDCVMFGDAPITTVKSAIEPNGGMEFPEFEDMLIKSAISMYTSRIEQAKKVHIISVGNDVNGAKHDDPDIKTTTRRLTVYNEGKLYSLTLFKDDKRDQISDYSKLSQGKSYLASFMISNTGRMYPVENPFISEIDTMKIDTMQILEKIQKDLTKLTTVPTKEDADSKKEFYVIGVISRPNPLIAKITTMDKFDLTIPNGSDMPEGSVCLVVGTIIKSTYTEGEYVMMQSYYIPIKQLASKQATLPTTAESGKTLPDSKIMNEKQVRSIFD